LKQKSFNEFYEQIKSFKIVPAGRVLFGAGSKSNVTYFNCFVMPFVKDSREGIANHRKEVMEIMSRGGGVGTNGSCLRPKNSSVSGVNGRTSGSVS
jgi:ribonucleoside-diphosphate reductase alpha chain